MNKTIEFIIVAVLLVFAFFAGVKYSDSIKNHASWLFETKDEEEVALPDLSNEGGDVSVTIEEGVPAVTPSEAPTDDATPMENIDTKSSQPLPATAQ